MVGKTARRVGASIAKMAHEPSRVTLPLVPATMVTIGVTRHAMAKTMRAGEFKAKCLEAMDEVACSGAPIVISKRGKRVAQLAPLAAKPKTLRGFLKGRVKPTGDIVRPVNVRWNADRG